MAAMQTARSMLNSLASAGLLAVGATAKAGRVVPVARGMRGGHVQAAVAVEHRVDVVDAAKGPRRIGGPLVEVAHHVERAFGGDAAGVRAGRREAVRFLVDARA